MDRAWLERVARQYLERYPTTSQNLRRVLRRRIQKTVVREEIEDPEAIVATLFQSTDELIQRLVQVGAIDDEAYVRARTRTLLRRGKAPPLIRQELRAKGASKEIVDEVVGSVDARDALKAAARLVRKRRLGPYHTDANVRRARRQKELQVLGRAGFRFADAVAVLDLPEVEAIEALIREEP